MKLTQILVAIGVVWIATNCAAKEPALLLADAAEHSDLKTVQTLLDEINAVARFG